MGHKTKARILRSQLAFGKKWGISPTWEVKEKKLIGKEEMLAKQNYIKKKAKLIPKTTTWSKTKAVPPARRPSLPKLPGTSRGTYTARKGKLTWRKK